MNIFKKGQNYANNCWFTGGMTLYTVTGRSENEVYFVTESHEADGTHTSEEKHLIDRDDAGNESVLIYEYKGHENRIVASEVTEEEAYADYYRAATRPCTGADCDPTALNEATLVQKLIRQGGAT
jgi:hypothetical protein